MKITKKWDRRTKLEKLYDENLEELLVTAENRKETVEALNMIGEHIADAKKRRVSPDTMAVVVGNLAGIGLILNFEKVNVIATKALGFVLKGRV